MGKRDYRGLSSRVTVLLTHLLKWRYQDARRGTRIPMQCRRRPGRQRFRRENSPSNAHGRSRARWKIRSNCRIPFYNSNPIQFQFPFHECRHAFRLFRCSPFDLCFQRHERLNRNHQTLALLIEAPDAIHPAIHQEHRREPALIPVDARMEVARQPRALRRPAAKTY